MFLIGAIMGAAAGHMIGFRLFRHKLVREVNLLRKFVREDDRGYEFILDALKANGIDFDAGTLATAFDVEGEEVDPALETIREANRILEKQAGIEEGQLGDRNVLGIEPTVAELDEEQEALVSAVAPAPVAPVVAAPVAPVVAAPVAPVVAAPVAVAPATVAVAPAKAAPAKAAPAKAAPVVAIPAV